MIGKYYRYLSRTDHPVFKRKNLSEVNPESFNSVLNYMIAVELSKIDDEIQKLYLDQFPHTVSENDISNWESEYFDFVKNGRPFLERRSELLDWINNNIRMSLPDVYTVSEAIVGKRPEVIVNASKGFFILGNNKLGATTIFKGQDTPTNRQTYIVRFNVNIPTELINRLDIELTNREKGGSKHIISYLPQKWILGESALGVDSYFR